MRVRKFIILVIFFMLSLSLFSCSIQSTTNIVKVTSKDAKATRIVYDGKDFGSIDTYFLDDGICYVDVEYMYQVFSQLAFTFDVETSLNDDIVLVKYKTYYGYESLSLNASNNEVLLSSPNFYLYFTDKSSAFSQNYELYNFSQNLFTDAKIRFDLDTYGLSSYITGDGRVLLPISIFSLIYTGENNCFFNYVREKNDGYIVVVAGGNQSLSLLSSSVEVTVEERNLSYNFLKLFIGEFYGLADYKGLNTISAIESFLSPYKEDLLSIDSKTFATAEVNVIDALDDPHTSTVYTSKYYEATPQGGIRYNQIFNKQYLYSYNRNGSFANTSFNDTYYSNDCISLVYDNTLFIVFDEFKSNFGHDSTYNFVRTVLNRYVRNNRIKNVVVDLTTNTGGEISEGLGLLSFMTNDNIKISYSYKNTKIYGSFTGEFNNDFDYNGSYDNDAYTNVNWYIMTSAVSFSCANLVPAIAKDLGIAKIIGKKSGGGMCAVGYCMLPDGTYFSKSSPLYRLVTASERANKEHIDIEAGVTPDYELDDTMFYNYKKLVNYINRL